jgi:hypothetical protein
MNMRQLILSALCGAMVGMPLLALGEVTGAEGLGRVEKARQSGMKPLLEQSIEFTASEKAPNKKNTLWYKQPADSWDEALPIGNGRLGGMVYGGISKEIIVLNEDTLWGGPPRQTSKLHVADQLATARKLTFAKDFYGA